MDSASAVFSHGFCIRRLEVCAYIAQQVERNHGKVEVTGSNPVVGSTHVASPHAKGDNFH